MASASRKGAGSNQERKNTEIKSDLLTMFVFSLWTFGCLVYVIRTI